MRVGKVVCKYMGMVIRNTKVKFIYDMTTINGHVFIREDYKNGFTLNDEQLELFLNRKKCKVDFGVSKGIFWAELQS
ncbi:hypothetical protein EEL30_22010 [Brevibacillus laterosporus]|uniref:Uncharacterized protein n=1 Tax=Brevibacillus laterosporus TaxID=1465 RepID=A0A518VCP5_BRELA|nr:hypothetical protein EEL30_22010 [Brevibacillus laterosporus]